MRIVYDEAKRQANLLKHGLDFAALTLEFFLACRIEPAKQGRSLAIGQLNGTAMIAVVFRPLGSEAISVISMRRANMKERGKPDV